MFVLFSGHQGSNFGPEADEYREYLAVFLEEKPQWHGRTHFTPQGRGRNQPRGQVAQEEADQAVRSKCTYPRLKFLIQTKIRIIFRLRLSICFEYNPYFHPSR